MNIQEILKLIPHRYPFLLVDKIVSSEESSIIGQKNVTFNEPQFSGHFPDNPVMPGVLIIEAMAQTAAILVAKKISDKKDRLIYFMSIEDAKFRKVVCPGDTMMIHVSILQQHSHVWKFSGKVMVENSVVAESVFKAMVK